MTQIYHIYSIYHVFEVYVPIQRGNTREYTSTQVEILVSTCAAKRVLVSEYSFECEYGFGRAHEYSYS